MGKRGRPIKAPIGYTPEEVKDAITRVYSRHPNATTLEVERALLRTDPELVRGLRLQRNEWSRRKQLYERQRPANDRPMSRRKFDRVRAMLSERGVRNVTKTFPDSVLKSLASALKGVGSGPLELSRDEAVAANLLAQVGLVPYSTVEPDELDRKRTKGQPTMSDTW